MKKSFVILVLFCLIGLLFPACKKDQVVEPQVPLAPAILATSLHGRILNEVGVPVSFARVKIGTKTVTATEEGEFFLKNIDLPEGKNLITVTRYNYFDGSRTVFIKKNTNNNMELRLIQRTSSGSFNGSSGGVVNVGTGAETATITFPANAVVTESGTAYNGGVSVYAYYLSPSNPNLLSLMPGSLEGRRTTNATGILTSFGMLNVELEGFNGIKLQLASGKTAQLKLPVPANAPTTIPLWYFDTTAGIWKEEGTATIQNGKYVANVAHFTWWNCDTFAERVVLSLRVLNRQGVPLQGVKTRLERANGMVGESHTNSEGTSTGEIPANETLTLKVYDLCGTLLSTQTIGPFSVDTNLGDITINDNQQSFTYTGNVTDCNNSPIETGYVYLTFPGNVLAVPVTNGSYTAVGTVCVPNQPAIIQAYNGNLASEETNTVITAGNGTLPTLALCSAAAEYITYQIDGGSVYSSYSVTIKASAGSDSLYLHLDDVPNTFSFNMRCPTPTTLGSVDADYVWANDGSLWFNSTQARCQFTAIATNIGEFYEGTFSGYAITTNSPQTAVPITGSFRAKRE